MLEYLHVKNLALIRDAEIDFKDHMNILSGETGAGKSILLGSISLALGKRAGKDMIRSGEEYAYVELVFRVEDNLVPALKALDVYPDDGRIILTRRLTENRSVGKLNGETVTAALLKQVSELLIDIHGQHDHQSLLHEENHRGVLDAFGKDIMEESLRDYQSLYESYRSRKEALKRLGGDSDEERQRRMDFLDFQIEEIENAGLRPGEEAELQKEHKKLANGRIISEGLQNISGLLSEGASDNVSQSVRILSGLTAYDESLKEVLGTLRDIEALMEDVGKDISNTLSDTDFDGQRLYEVEERLDQISALKRKYGKTEEEILKALNTFIKDREELQAFEENRENLLTELEEEKKKLILSARKLREKRQEAASLFDARLTLALKDLNFLDVHFVTEILESVRYTRSGADDIRFLISTNPGEELRPLSRVASGGELSRIMLAIRTLIAGSDNIHTLIFDEIDTGISGKTGAAVAEKMHEIAEKHQVICISHLPQIVAVADHHFMIEKTAEEDSTVVHIHELDEEASDRELARLLGAGVVTDTVLANAREMKAYLKHS